MKFYYYNKKLIILIILVITGITLNLIGPFKLGIFLTLEKYIVFSQLPYFERVLRTVISVVWGIIVMASSIFSIIALLIYIDKILKDIK